MTNEVLHGLLRTKPTVLTESGSGTAYIQTSIRLPVDLSDEASQAAEGGREEGCADSSSVAPLYTLLCRPLALWTSLLVTNDVPGVLRDFVCVYFVYILFMSLKSP